MPKPRRIALLTTGRQDYGILRSTIRAFREDPRIDPSVWAGGMHLEPRFGRPVERIRADGAEVTRELPFLSDPPDPALDAGEALRQVARALREEELEALLLTGDRYETAVAGIAAVLERVPLIHLHGGEETEGAMDNAFRHALTKMSHLHLVSHPEHARRVHQMGEPGRNVVVVGPPGCDNLHRDDLLSRTELRERLEDGLEEPVVLVTVHPTTLGSATPLAETEAVAAAMERVEATYVVTQSNADAGGEEVREFWRRWAEGRDRVTLVDELGERVYWSLLRVADAVLGNSSSGIIEAPAAGVPAVNVGDRQQGRLRPAGVRDVPAEAGAVEAALKAALEGEPAPGADVEPYPESPAAPRILEAVAAWEPPDPPRKRFRDLPVRTDE